ncbi:hypothetical protein RINTU1_17630 [Candidatus Regiella insecticola]|uniref:Uncharacterized protein n=1 Tax=Candidatus Regiella insecticola TaxID=138073 RepID=A0A6L2ZN26_9ENTR|nr:hypothetical protein RINTU1_17630 [Candidatus Regiella insecticola]
MARSQGVAVYIPTALEVVFGCQGVRPMSVDILTDETNTRSQQLGASRAKGIGFV